MIDSITRQGAPIPFYGHQDGEIAVAVATSDHINHPFHQGYVLVTTALGSLAGSSDCADPATCSEVETTCCAPAWPAAGRCSRCWWPNPPGRVPTCRRWRSSWAGMNSSSTPMTCLL